jgi:hypothetical protein
LRKKPGDIFDVKLNSMINTNIPPRTGRLCTRLTPTMKRRKETSFTRGSKICNKPGERLISSVVTTDSRTRLKPEILLVRKSSPFNLKIPL